MKSFHCECGQRLFFGNMECLNCERQLGFDIVTDKLLPLTTDEHGLLHHGDRVFRLCKNQVEFGVCNWLVEKNEDHYCMSCDLNETIPDVGDPVRKQKWAKIENAKRRLVYSLRQLLLPVVSRHKAPNEGLGFAFMEDSRGQSYGSDYSVMTGHHNGLITVNIAEADPLFLERTRQEMGEPYRTLIGHLRHESGHYFFNRLIDTEEKREAFRAVFGDERMDYQQALSDHYASPDKLLRKDGFISAYASSHPAEDWAETWAHYLHMRDTMETAVEFDVAETYPPIVLDIDAWNRLTMVINELNRSLGLPDAYPFVITPDVTAKLQFIHRMVS